jgi:4-oxalocrotonate tautomerase
MPIINVRVSTTVDDIALEAKVAAKVTELAQTHLGKDPNLTAVIVDRVGAQSWFCGGRSLADHQLASYWLSIKVVQGTNTKDEKAAFLSNLYQAMSELLGELHPESYAHVDEVLADAYGFTGVTQERRYIERRLLPQDLA